MLIFAVLVPTSAPAIMQVQIEQPPRAVGVTTLELHLADPQGLPIEQAQIMSSARMTNMEMITHESHVKEVGQGTYLAQLHLYMADYRDGACSWLCSPPAECARPGDINR